MDPRIVGYATLVAYFLIIMALAPRRGACINCVMDNVRGLCSFHLPRGKYCLVSSIIACVDGRSG